MFGVKGFEPPMAKSFIIIIIKKKNFESFTFFTRSVMVNDPTQRFHPLRNSLSGSSHITSDRKIHE